MGKLQKLFDNNRIWVNNQTAKDADFFKKLAAGQKPEYLWIGCGDSRIPAEEILGLTAGEVFVHRNVANQVLYTDINARSVVEYAVLHLKVKHVIVCGHYGCGGVKAALGTDDLGETLNMWLKSIKEVYVENKAELESLPTTKEKEERLVELNVLKQVDRLLHTSSLQKGWKENNGPEVHGWAFSLETGLIKSLIDIEPGAAMDDIYKFKTLW